MVDALQQFAAEIGAAAAVREVTAVTRSPGRYTPEPAFL
jgi:hypothetical protein